MASNHLQRVEGRVQDFVQEITRLVRAAALEAVAGALGEGGKRPRRGRPPGSKSKSAGGRPRGKRGKRTTEQVEAMAARVFAHVKKNPGLGMEKLAKAMKTASKELTLPITRLLEGKKLRTTGQRRGTKYFAK